MKKVLFCFVVVFLSIFLFTTHSYAISQDEVIRLSQKGLSDTDVIEIIEASGTVYTLSGKDEKRLAKGGVSRKVINAMNSTGSQAGGKFTPQEGVVSNIIIILDSSGSMSKETKDNQEKLGAAKKAVDELLDSLPGGLNTGVIVYGHRYQGRCDDIELVSGVKPLDGAVAAGIKRKIKDLTPLGVTPIAGSLELAGKTLKDFEGENGIILISDGKETCGGDPVKVAKDLEAKYGIKVYIDVVGFDVTSNERRQLENIAKAGGGRYYNAKTSKELRLVTQKAAQKVIQIPPPPKPKPKPKPQPKPTPKPVPPPPPPVEEAEFLDRGAIERQGEKIRGGKYYDDAVEIRPGKYRLNHKLQAGEFDYFKIQMKNGQRLTCSARTTEVSSYAGVAIHSAERARLVNVTVISTNQKKECYQELFDMPREETTYYIVIGQTYGESNENVIYDIIVDDHYDAGSATDAGKDYDTPIKIEPGKYKKNWACFGDVDMYLLEVKKGDEIKVKILPDKNLDRYYLTIINEDRETMANVVNKEGGSVAKASWINDVGDQEVYVKVHHGPYGGGDVGTYIMKIGVEKAPEPAPQ